ncbi:MAG: hypothetical protein QOD80_5, partial [Verrucomicrobiota bacterium]
ALSHGAATNIARANEENAFHDNAGAVPASQVKIKRNQVNAAEHSEEGADQVLKR